jgi:nucleoside-diphosphate-sugar epimerase
MFDSMRLVLGAGYTGHFLIQKLRQEGYDVRCTRRSSSAPDVIPFDLENESTWANLPTADVTYWTFPPSSLELAKRFLAKHKVSMGRIAMVGTTSAFVVDTPDAIITETTPKKPNLVRNSIEDFFLSQGAVVVHAAGIYGPGRDPRRWMSSGRVQPSSKYLNLIHVEDLCQILIAAGDYRPAGAPSGKTYLAADGNPYRWVEIFNRLGVAAPPAETKAETPESKRIDPQKTLGELKVTLKYPDLFSGLISLQKN